MSLQGRQSREVMFDLMKTRRKLGISFSPILVACLASTTRPMRFRHAQSSRIHSLKAMLLPRPILGLQPLTVVGRHAHSKDKQRCSSDPFNQSANRRAAQKVTEFGYEGRIKHKPDKGH